MGTLGPHHSLELADFPPEDFAVEEEKRREGLVLRGGGDGSGGER